jgi:hypothetical protein
VRGLTFLRSEVAKTQSVLAHICIGHAIWWSASSTGSSNAGASPPDMTNSPQTTLPSSSSQRLEFGCVLMSPRPSSCGGEGSKAQVGEKCDVLSERTHLNLHGIKWTHRPNRMYVAAANGRFKSGPAAYLGRLHQRGRKRQRHQQKGGRRKDHGHKWVRIVHGLLVDLTELLF